MSRAVTCPVHPFGCGAAHEPRPARVQPRQYAEPTDRREYVEPHELSGVVRADAGGSVGVCSCGERFTSKTSPSKGGASIVAARHRAHAAGDA